MPLFAPLLSLPLPEDRYPPLALSPQRQRQKTLESIVAILLEQAEQQTVLFILEDLHWTDPSTLELLDLLIDQIPTASIMTLLTCRPAFQPPWSSRSYLTQVTLHRLSRYQIERMAAHVAGGKHLPAEVLQQIVEKTDGVPLFVEEMTKAILESGVLKATADQYEVTGPLPALAIPATLQDSLMARLDRLVSAKGIAQLGAVIGRQFSYELLQAVSQLAEPTLQRALSQLIEAELLYQRGLPPHATYLFKHALIRDTAYASLLKSTRQQDHQRIALALEERFSETAEAQPELLAHHYTEAGLSDRAVAYWRRAGQRAVQRSAYVEAINHLTRGLALLSTLPDTSERTQRELEIQTALGPALIASKGYAAPEVVHAYARARELCHHVGDIAQLFSVIQGLGLFYLFVAEYQTAHELADQLLSLAQRQHDPTSLLIAHRALGLTLFYRGKFPAARAHLEQGIALYDAQRHRSYAGRYVVVSMDPGVACLSHAAYVLWPLGYPNLALQQTHEMLTLAQEVPHPFSMSFASFAAALVHQLRREVHALHEHAEAAMALSTAQGFPVWSAYGTIMRGWALAMQGQEEDGRAQLHQGIAAYWATGAELAMPYFLSLLAEAYRRGDQAEAGLCAVAEALALVDNTGERCWEAELHHLKGELLLLQSSNNQTEAETCFQQALAIARNQQAKAWELRAATSLARLWHSQDKRQDAYDLLAPVYEWFTEGFDTADLQEAKGLLEELLS